MAGSSPSAIRAAIMFSIFAWGLMFQKNNNSLNQLFATAFLLLCAQPTWLYSIGFQLSFIAVLSLILFYSPIHGLLLSKNKWVKKVWATICASLAAEILVAPVVIYYFHNFPLLFLVANVAAYLFMGLVLILGIAIIALSWLPVVAKVVGAITTGLVLFFDKMISWMQGLNPISFRFLLLTIPQLAFFYLSITGIAYLLLRKKKAALFTGLAAFSIFIGLLCSNKWTSIHQQQLVVYNVSKGNHIEYLTEGQYHVIDPDTLPAKKVEYATKPSHIQWQSWKKGDSMNDELFRINNQTVLILNKEPDTARKFPADYLIINYSGTIDPLQLATTCSPKLIIIGNNYSRKQQEHWIKAADACHIPIHTLSRDGAFILGD